MKRFVYFYFCFFKDLARISQGVLNENKWGTPINLEVDLMFISTNLIYLQVYSLRRKNYVNLRLPVCFFPNNYACLKKIEMFLFGPGKWGKYVVGNKPEPSHSWDGYGMLLHLPSSLLSLSLSSWQTCSCLAGHEAAFQTLTVVIMQRSCTSWKLMTTSTDF